MIKIKTIETKYCGCKTKLQIYKHGKDTFEYTYDILCDKHKEERMRFVGIIAETLGKL